MGVDERREFEMWYEDQKHKTFDFQEEIISYVRDDTSVLREACLSFREKMLHLTGGLDSDGTINTKGIDVFSKVSYEKRNALGIQRGYLSFCF